jgi:hypothetical protein
METKKQTPAKLCHRENLGIIEGFAVDIASSRRDLLVSNNAAVSSKVPLGIIPFDEERIEISDENKFSIRIYIIFARNFMKTST